MSRPGGSGDGCPAVLYSPVSEAQQEAPLAGEMDEVDGGVPHIASGNWSVRDREAEELEEVPRRNRRKCERRQNSWWRGVAASIHGCIH
jgi:hypothetical protein